MVDDTIIPWSNHSLRCIAEIAPHVSCTRMQVSRCRRGRDCSLQISHSEPQRSCVFTCAVAKRWNRTDKGVCTRLQGCGCRAGPEVGLLVQVPPQLVGRPELASGLLPKLRLRGRCLQRALGGCRQPAGRQHDLHWCQRREVGAQPRPQVPVLPAQGAYRSPPPESEVSYGHVRSSDRIMQIEASYGHGRSIGHAAARHQMQFAGSRGGSSD